MRDKESRWRFAADMGGTFTDVVGIDPDGGFHVLKLLSRSPRYRDASVEGIRRMLGLGSDEALPFDRVGRIRFGTTVATNALLERRGSRVALVITSGLKDVLEIGHQSRPDIFSLCIRKPGVLYSSVIEAVERMGPDGRVVEPLDTAALEADANMLKAAGVDAVAVVLLHSWKNPVHELEAEDLLRRCGIRDVFLSHRVRNLIKITGRGQSCLLDAYLYGAIKEYVNAIRAETGPVPLEFMRSSGSLSGPEDFRGHDALLSGPAGGVVAVAGVARALGLKGVVGFDMGGTSTDVSRFDGEYEMCRERTVAGVEFQAETMNIVTIASGGGSVLRFDGGRMRVGPQSAGAEPGPASYGRGGPLTVTDANLVTGRILPEHFPRTFGPAGDSPLDAGAAGDRLRVLALKTGNGDIGELALGFLRVVNEQMATAIKEISVSKGFDVRDYALVCFGGAGGQHACQVASILGIGRIVFHPLGGVMSAYGLGLANPSMVVEKTVLMPYTDETHPELERSYADMAREAGCTEGTKISRYLDIRPRGTDAFITVKCGSYRETISGFEESYRRRFGFYPDAVLPEAVNLRLEAVEETDFFPPYGARRSEAAGVPEPVSTRRVLYPDGHADVSVYEAGRLPTGASVCGPAIVVDGYSTLVVDPGFEACTGEDGIITIEKVSDDRTETPAPDGGPDPVLLEVFENAFRSIATEMGHTLKNSAHSVNIKERLDFSCAVFDGGGGLVANAPHIPVHLGSMADTVRAVIEDRSGDMMQGDMYLTNDPYRGGSHLPDLTVVCPVFSENGDLIFFTASRGHHADVGGSTAGSMPPVVSSLEEEGVVVRNFTLVRDGVFRERQLRQLLEDHRCPARNPSENIEDLRAQAAACQKGVSEILGLIGRYGKPTVHKYMGHVQSNAEHAVRRALWQLLDGRDTFSTSFSDRLDDGTPIAVSVKVTAGTEPPLTTSAVIDFEGTGAEHLKDNLNAPLAVTRSAVLYVLKTITAEDFPLNSGCLTPVKLRVPAASVLNPTFPRAVASGNVETSQRVVDVLLGALGAAAASQGTMNNLLFEVRGESPYYETIAGGSGASPGCPGASGVQVHMTNTRITDPEVLECRHPGVRLGRFEIRGGSGGRGLYAGGNGVIREIRFHKPGRVSIISERRTNAPYGLMGGMPGASGRNLYIKSGSDSAIELPGRASLEVESGDSIVIETPGGGGWQPPQ
jgi:5-oxoprolinase (ATP-hydrolysing)